MNDPLLASFEEEVQNPLRPLGGRKEDVERVLAERKRRKFINSFSLPNMQDMSRNDWLEVLVKGAWVGIGILVGVFIVVHFVIVGDFVPK